MGPDEVKGGGTLFICSPSPWEAPLFPTCRRELRVCCPVSGAGKVTWSRPVTVFLSGGYCDWFKGDHKFRVRLAGVRLSICGGGVRKEGRARFAGAGITLRARLAQMGRDAPFPPRDGNGWEGRGDESVLIQFIQLLYRAKPLGACTGGLHDHISQSWFCGWKRS